jgi:endonuclease YncB( thermonuclease family)
MPGCLRIRGKLNVKQFWPTGTSDADTVNLIVDVNRRSFQFAEDGRNFRTTTVFFGAIAVGRGRKQVVSDKNKITIRLQGVDAPELHYKASPLTGDVSKAKRKAFNEANEERLQHWGETAAVGLGKKVADFGNDMIDCEFFSVVEKPFDVTDVYGRFVGNVRLGRRFDFDINTWLVEQGFAYPSFYDSMSREEIDVLLKARNKGKNKRVFKDYARDTTVFFANLLYRRPKKNVVIQLRDDTGKLLMPKVYRRQVTYRMQKKAGLITGSFAKFMASQTKPDQFHKLGEFMKPTGGKNAPVYNFRELFEGNTFDAQPHELVVREAGATLVDSRGREVDDFFP